MKTALVFILFSLPSLALFGLGIFAAWLLHDSDIVAVGFVGSLLGMLFTAVAALIIYREV